MTEVTSPLMVSMRHVRKAQLCSKGARAWFARQGLSWQDFLDGGLPAEVLEATGDAMALRAVEAARAEQDGR